MWKLYRHSPIWVLIISCCVKLLFGQSNVWTPNLPSTVSGHGPDSTREERPLPTARLGPEDQHLLWISDQDPFHSNDPSALPPPNIPDSLPWDHAADGFHNPSQTVNVPSTGSQAGVPVGNHGSTDQVSSLLDQNSGILLDPSVSSIQNSHIPPSPLEFPSGQSVDNFVAVNESIARKAAAERRRERRRQRRLERERARANFLDAAARDQAAFDAFDGNNQGIFPASPLPEPIPNKTAGGRKKNKEKKKNKAKQDAVSLKENPDIPLPPGFVPLSVAEQVRLLETISLLEDENARLTLVVSEQRKLLDDMMNLAAEKASIAAEKEKAEKIAAEKKRAAEIAAEKKRAAEIAAAKKKAALEKERADRIAAEKQRLAKEAEERRLAELQKAKIVKPVVPYNPPRRRRRRRRRLLRFFG